MRNMQARQIKPPSVGAAIAKIAFGALFVVIGFAESYRGVVYVATSLIMGAALIAWGVLVYRNGKKMWEEQQSTLREQEVSRVHYCRHCGARTSGRVCEYCGSPLD